MEQLGAKMKYSYKSDFLFETESVKSYGWD